MPSLEHYEPKVPAERTYGVYPGASHLENLRESMDRGFQHVLEKLPFISPLHLLSTNWHQELPKALGTQASSGHREDAGSQLNTESRKNLGHSQHFLERGVYARGESPEWGQQAGEGVWRRAFPVGIQDGASGFP